MKNEIENKESKNNKINVGSALVVGGGIGGMQAALDLAGSGIKVYLSETKPCIGGIMSQLDKTFPTNDCSMCIMAPKLVEIGRHKDIDIITLADIEGIKGEAGNFKVTIKKRARYIDKINLSPCRSACPAGCDNQAYIALISQGKFKEALEVIRERIPLPAICGRTCNAPCEDICNRGEIDESLSIRALKRFAADYEMYSMIKEKENGESQTEKVVQIPRKNKKVAVIGSGPAGLTVSYDLAKMGYQVVIFEASSVAGGMLRLGIPKFRLPPEVIDYEIEIIKKAGVEILTNTAIGPDMTLNDLFNRGYESIFIAIGTHKSLTLNIEGENLDGVIHGVGFLQSIRTGREVDFKDKAVAVIGGGNVAIDSVRTALRLGAKEAFIIYRG